jgi:hypothetical protein
LAGIGQDLKKIYSDETRIVENASLCTGLLLLHPKIGVLLLETSSTLSTFTFSKSRQTADSLSNKV